MEAASVAPFVGRSRAYQGILWGGLIAGVLDLTYAFVAFKRGPIWILQSIASGLLGESAFKGGLGAAALGVVCHFLVATGAAALYYAASRKLPFLVRRPVVCGLLYGITIYLFMNFVVLPLSAFPFKLSFPLRALIPGLLCHMFLIGLPIALAVRRYSK